MTPEEALQVADEALFAHSDSSLMDIQRLILRESLAGKGYESIEGYTSQHVKNEGKKLWDVLSEALGEKVSKTNFKGALEKRWKSRGIVPKAPELTTYNLQTWVGRKAIVDELLNKLQGQTRLLWIAGISGIGKTTLGECIGSKAWEREPSFQWIRLEILEGQSPDFASVVTDLLAKLGEKDLDPQERNDPKRLLDRLLRKLQTTRYWIQLDALERLLDREQPNEFADGYWLTFLHRYLAEPNLVSRLVLTAQALPAVVAEFGDRYPNVWQEITLRGLSVDDQYNEHLELFEKNGIITNDSNRSTLSRIGQIYEGHPLVLQVIAKEILALPFQGSVAEYWLRYDNEFEQVARELQTDRVNPALYNQSLQRQVRRRVEASLKRLPTDALDLLCRSSVYRRPVPETFWLTLIEDKSLIQQQEAYQVLCDRALIEKESVSQGQFLIRQHNLIRDITYTQLKNNPTIWKSIERNAAEIWLNAYKPNPNSPNLEKVRGYLEAIDCYCEIEDWQRAKDLFINALDISAQYTLFGQLETWSYFWEGIRVCQKLLDHCGDEVDIRCWNGIGNAYFYLGYYPKSIEAHEHSLKIARKIGDIKGEGDAFNNLGLNHHSFGDYQQAIYYYNQYLTISLTINNRQGEGTAIGNLGVIYQDLGEYHEAIDLHTQYLKISREIDNPKGESDALSNLGLIYYRLNEYQKAIDFQQKALAIKRNIGNRIGESNSLGGLGNAFLGLKNYQKAINFYQQHLILSQEIKYRRGEGSALVNLGVALIRMEQYSEAIKKIQSALALFQEIGDRLGEALAFQNLAELHQKIGQVDLARQHCQQALFLAKQMEIPLAAKCEALHQKLQESQLLKN